MVWKMAINVDSDVNMQYVNVQPEVQVYVLHLHVSLSQHNRLYSDTEAFRLSAISQ